MISNHKLIIDKNCPMCNLYGNCFVKTKLLDNHTIQHYQTIDSEIFNQIDKERAKSEVAFIDTESGEIKYGAAAFTHILSHKSKGLRWFFRLNIISFLILKLYRFISFNRHVMSGVGLVKDERDCTPNSHLGYRWLYIVLGALVTGFLVNRFASAVDRELLLIHSDWREYLVCFGQIAWQFVALSFIDKDKRMDYLGNMTTVSLIGGGLLLIILFMDSLFKLGLFELLVGFGLIVSYMLFIHLKRSSKLGLPISTSLSWVTFRTSVLIFILVLIF